MTRSPDVDAWFAASAHPMREVMQAVREVILGADARVTETIKWKTPTFMYKGNIASINPAAKRFASVLFHRGAEIPGDHPILTGGGDVARYAQFEDVAALERQRDELAAVIRAWCDDRDTG